MSNDLLISLAMHRIEFSATIGFNRWLEVLRNERRPEWGEDNADAFNHILGAMGECAYAHAIGARWPVQENGPDHHAPDVADWHVRTARRPGDSLILHEKDAHGKGDPDDGKFVLLVMYEVGEFRIPGWCYGHEGKNPLHWWEHTKRPAYFVPQGYLRPWDLDEWRL